LNIELVGRDSKLIRQEGNKRPRRRLSAFMNSAAREAINNNKETKMAETDKPEEISLSRRRRAPEISPFRGEYIKEKKASGQTSAAFCSFTFHQNR